MAGRASSAMWCRYCHRMRGVHCKSTRDMDPADGYNHDPECHAALVRLGGGERGRTVDDFKPAYAAKHDKASR